MRLQVTTLIIAQSTIKREEEVGKCCNTDIYTIKRKKNWHAIVSVIDGHSGLKKYKKKLI